MDNKWIYHQKKDNLYITKVFHNKREYYVGGFKNQDEARLARDKAIDEIINQGNLTKYRSRNNSKPRSKPIEIEITSNLFEEPEYQLRYAVLMSAIADLSRPSNKSEYNKSKNWIEGRIKSAKTFSFDEICELFHLNPSAVRDKVINEKIQ